MLAILLSLSACSVSHGVRPLGKGKMAVEGSLGGPTAELFGAPLPLPLSTLGVRYGLSDRSDLHAAIHPSLAGMFGIWGLDAGGGYQIFAQDGPRPAVVVDATGTLLFGDLEPGPPEGGLRFFGNVAALASWQYGERGNLLYTGADLFFQPLQQTHGGPLIGHQLRLGQRVALSTELKWMAHSVETEPLTVHYYGLGGHGVLIPQIGLSVAWGGAQ